MEKNLIRHAQNCRICDANDFDSVLHLTDTPLEDQYLPKKYLSIAQPTYPLKLIKCKACDYLFLSDSVDPNLSYENYIYKSNVTVGLKSHYEDYVISLINQFLVPPNSLALDLGSNDGSMLLAFKKCGLIPLGIEPAAEIAKYSNLNGLETINNFFDQSTKEKIAKKYGLPYLITANYMLANVDNLFEFTLNVKDLLDPSGIFVVQTGYHPDQFSKKMFDYIYHEHFSYFTLGVLKKLFLKSGLEIISAQKESPKGGSLRIISQKIGGPHKVSKNVDLILQEELEKKVNTLEFFNKFDFEIKRSCEILCSSLDELKNSNKKIVGFGASHSTTTLIYNFGLGKYLDYIVDDNPAKQNTFSPGLHIPVYSFEKIFEEFPDYILILSWQHADSIKNRHADYLSIGGTWIEPLPKLIFIN